MFSIETSERFWEQVIATLIGTSFGFIGSILLFWLKEWWVKKKHDSALKTNLIYELDYNLDLFKKYKDDITKCIDQINAGTKFTYLSIDYEIIARKFAQDFYNAGLLQKYFNVDDMKKWNDLLLNLNVGKDQYVKDRLEDWRKGNIDRSDIVNTLTFERTLVEEAYNTSRFIKNKLVKIS